MITLGGNAELELVDSMDPFSGGHYLQRYAPKEELEEYLELSGGEKVSPIVLSLQTAPDAAYLRP